MALTQSYVGHNIVGSKREDYVFATFTGVTSGVVKMRLKWIDSVDIENTSGGDATYAVYPNADSATADDPAAGGHLFFTGVTSGQTYTIRAIGR